MSGQLGENNPAKEKWITLCKALNLAKKAGIENAEAVILKRMRLNIIHVRAEFMTNSVQERCNQEIPLDCWKSAININWNSSEITFGEENSASHVYFAEAFGVKIRKTDVEKILDEAEILEQIPSQSKQTKGRGRNEDHWFAAIAEALVYLYESKEINPEAYGAQGKLIKSIRDGLAQGGAREKDILSEKSVRKLAKAIIERLKQCPSSYKMAQI